MTARSRFGLRFGALGEEAAAELLRKAGYRIVARNQGLGGKGYRFTVVCSDNGQTTHQQEVEFLVNFGF